MEDPQNNKRLIKHTGHQDYIKGIAYHPSGHQVASLSSDGMIKCWDLESSECIHTFTMEECMEFSDPPLFYSPDGKRLVACSGDTVEIWSAETGEKLQAISSAEGSIASIQWGDDQSLIALLRFLENEKIVVLWNITSNYSVEIEYTDVLDYDDIPNVMLSPDAKSFMVYSYESGDIKRFNIAKNSYDLLLKGHVEQVNKLVFSQDQNTLLSASDDNTIKRWDLTSGQCINTYSGHERHVVSMMLSPDETQFVSGAYDDVAKVWDIASGDCLQTLAGHRGWVNSVAFSPEGKHIISGSDDQSVKRWKVATGECVQTLEGYSLYVNSIAYSPDGKWLASGVSWRHVDIWDIATGVRLHSLDGHEGQVGSVAFSSDGRKVASTASDNKVLIWDVATGERLNSLECGEHWMLHNKVCYHPTLNQIAFTANNYTVRIWDLESGSLLKNLSGHTDDVVSIAYSWDGKTLASSAEDETIKVWDIETGECTNTLQCEDMQSASDVAFNPDASRLISCSYIGDVIYWDVKSGERLYANDESTQMIAYHPNQDQFASAGLDNCAKLWNAESGEVAANFAGHTAWVKSVDYRHDGKQLASGSNDASIKLWDLATNQCVKTIYYLPDENYAVVDELTQQFVYATEGADAYFRSVARKL